MPTAMVRKPVAVDLHRNRVRRIADQDDLAGDLLDAGHLAEHAARVEHGLTDEHAVARALVDQHALAKGVEIDIHDVADDEPIGHPRGVVAQRAQALALRLERLVALQAELGDAQLRLEPGLVGAQAVARGDALAEPMPALERARDRDLHRVGDEREDAANLAEMIVALVDDDEAERQQAIQHATEQQPRGAPRRVGATECDHGRWLP